MLKEPINVLLLGSGGREHALAWGISHSSYLDTLFIAPGNAGMQDLGELVSLSMSDSQEVVAFCTQNSIGLVVVGPEQPLVDGLADVLEQAGIAVFGPSAKAAQLEGSKAFAKQQMQAYGVPTAGYKVFNADQLAEAEAYIKQQNIYPVVLKADGLAAGKGVIIAQNEQEALEAIRQIIADKAFGAAGNQLVIEDFMEGEEVSVFALSDGASFLILGNAQDHKRIGEGDTGPNTGGMGAYSPAPILELDEAMDQRVIEEVIAPMLQGMAEDGMPYKGVLYAGLMITQEGPKVVEFNCRFGDPECQVIIPSIQSDVLQLLYLTAVGKLDEAELVLDGSHRCTVVLASEGYPAAYEKGKAISGLDELSDQALVFHSGTRLGEHGLESNGGRVLNVVHAGDSLQQALDKAYADIDRIHFEGKTYRRDIGFRGLEHYRHASAK
jgi:phosphoribosylamine--glycine ligase